MVDIGKFTISRIIARDFIKRCRLSVNFFFKKDEKDRDNAFHFFIIIVTQLMQNFSDLRSSFKKVLKKDSVVFTKILKKQFEKLVFEFLFGYKFH